MRPAADGSARRAGTSRPARIRSILARDGTGNSGTTSTPTRLAARTPTHRCSAVPAGTPPVSTISENSGSQKNLAGQRGPRRSAVRAWTATSTVASSGTTPSRATEVTEVTTSPPMDPATVPRPR